MQGHFKSHVAQIRVLCFKFLGWKKPQNIIIYLYKYKIFKFLNEYFPSFFWSNFLSWVGKGESLTFVLSKCSTLDSNKFKMTGLVNMLQSAQKIYSSNRKKNQL